MDNIVKQEILSQLESEEQFPVDFDVYGHRLEFSSKGNAKRAFEKAGFIMGQDFDHIIRFRLIWLNALREEVFS